MKGSGPTCVFFVFLHFSYFFVFLFIGLRISYVLLIFLHVSSFSRDFFLHVLWFSYKCPFSCRFPHFPAFPGFFNVFLSPCVFFGFLLAFSLISQRRVLFLILICFFDLLVLFFDPYLLFWILQPNLGVSWYSSARTRYLDRHAQLIGLLCLPRFFQLFRSRTACSSSRFLHFARSTTA